MPRFNTPRTVAQTRGGGPIRTIPPVTDGNLRDKTYNNAPGFLRDARSELFLLAVANFVGQKTFYEKADKRDDRYAQLVRTVAVADPDWIGRFLPWLRNEANMRTAAVVGAVEAAFALQDAKIPGSRQILANTLARADEPGEALAYAKQILGRKATGGVQRGIGDAARRLYTQYASLVYNAALAEHVFRFGDVIEITRPRPGTWEQSQLFGYLISRDKGRDGVIVPDELTMLVANQALRKQVRDDPEVLLNTTRLKMAGFRWEDALPLLGDKVTKKELWEALIPNMPYMALLRNLRNFDEAGVSNDVVQNVVIPKLTDPAQVAKSRQLPMRFLSAHRASKGSLRWGHALSQALEMSLDNVPHFPGATLILIDTSGSMHTQMSDKSGLMYWDAATIFGLALARRCEIASVYSFSNGAMPFPAKPGEALLASLERWEKGRFFQNGGTNTHGCLRQTYKNHDRVVILTDEQANAHGAVHVAAGIVPDARPVITFNLAGYRAGHMPAGSLNRITIGGLSDSAFKLLPALEAVGAGGWPF